MRTPIPITARSPRSMGPRYSSSAPLRTTCRRSRDSERSMFDGASREQSLTKHTKNGFYFLTKFTKCTKNSYSGLARARSWLVLFLVHFVNFVRVRSFLGALCERSRQQLHVRGTLSNAPIDILYVRLHL